MTNTLNDLTDEDYAAIGRAIVERASTKASKSEWKKRGAYSEVVLEGFKIRLRTRSEAAPGTFEPEIRPGPCCICVLEYDIVICKGPCCEPSWK